MRVLTFIAATMAVQAAPNAIEVVNNHPFAIRQPVGDVIVNVGANSRATVSLPQQPRTRMLEVRAEGAGLRLTSGGADLGRMTFGLIVKPAGAVDHIREFDAIDLKFKAAAPQALYTDWKGEGSHCGFAITAKARAWIDGFLDWSLTLRNAEADHVSRMYGAVVARWERPAVRRHLLSYDNRAEDFDPAGRTRFSAGDGRHHSLQHGIDWIALDFGQSAAVVLNSFSQLSTGLDDAYSVRNKSPRFLGASLPQFKNEARTTAGALYLIAEFARDNRPYRDRFLESRLPDVGRSITYEQRIAFQRSMPARERADRDFVGYNTHIRHEAGRIDIGVPGVIFGTSYFPYSTLGENFGELKLPGQQTDAFWPLSADTVTRWKEFAGDIRRDLRIAKAMGFSVIRLHYVDVIAKLPEAVQFEYLDFVFDELRRLKLRAMFSTAFPYWRPEQIAARVARYKDVIDRLEIENEILIWGIPLDRPQYWARIHAEVKKVAPDVRIHWTGHLNTGIFDRLDDLRVKYDVVSAHSYIDAPDAIPSGRGFAFAAGNYASRRGMDAIYTEWNWRGFTRMTPEARGRVYPPIMENLLATRSIRELHQFQFQQTMCVNPHTRRGIRQYEPLWLSRRPKPEAFELMKLIERYSPPESPVRWIGIDHPVADLAAGEAAVTFQLRNLSSSELRLRMSVDGPEELQGRLERAEFNLAPGVTARVPVRVSAKGALKPGFYHVFLRLEGPNGLVRYGWAEVRNPGQPEGAAFDLNRRIALVYAQDCPNIEMEAAYLLAATIESASGRPVGLYSEQDLPAGDTGAVIAVGKTRRPGAVAIDGFDAAVKFALSYWMHAKDSGARRIGLVKKQVPAGADVANLP